MDPHPLIPPDLAAKASGAPLAPVEAAFSRLLGRTPTAEERERLWRIKDALRLDDGDSLWLIILAMEEYWGLIDGVPDRIREASADTLRQHREALAAEPTKRTTEPQTVGRTAAKIGEGQGRRPDRTPHGTGPGERWRRLSLAALAGSTQLGIIGGAYAAGWWSAAGCGLRPGTGPLAVVMNLPLWAIGLGLLGAIIGGYFMYGVTAAFIRGLRA